MEIFELSSKQLVIVGQEEERDTLEMTRICFGLMTYVTFMGWDPISSTASGKCYWTISSDRFNYILSKILKL